MKRILSFLVILALALPTVALGAQADLAAGPKAVIEQLYQGDYQQVFDQSSADVQSALQTPESLGAQWAMLAQAYGDYEGVTSATAQEQNGMIVGQITCRHANASITYVVALDKQGQLIGLTVAAVNPDAAASTADPSTFVAEPITLRPGEADETQGMLTLPTGDGPFPAVIMMQGSGASDMNETAFGISVFRDIAEMLAQAGVASIRYDKYTYAHADRVTSSFTVEQEYILDAADALKLLQADSRIGDIYLLGHSEGAIILPRVMQSLGAENLAGGVLLAGSPLPLWEIQYHQNLASIAALSVADQAAAQVQLDAELAKLDTMDGMTDEELQSTPFFGILAWYQMDLASVDEAQTAIALQKPLFIAQGAKDWQVTPADGIDAWQEALGDQLAVSYHLYPNMTHLLFDMEGMPANNLSDYAAGGTVSPTLVQDIAAWILGE